MAPAVVSQTQETLQKLPWPARLLDDELCREMTAGDLWQSPATAGKGAKVISGLRVRMGINTGVLCAGGREG